MYMLQFNFDLWLNFLKPVQNFGTSLHFLNRFIFINCLKKGLVFGGSQRERENSSFLLLLPLPDLPQCLYPTPPFLCRSIPPPLQPLSHLLRSVYTAYLCPLPYHTLPYPYIHIIKDICYFLHLLISNPRPLDLLSSLMTTDPLEIVTGPTPIFMK